MMMSRGCGEALKQYLTRVSWDVHRVGGRGEGPFLDKRNLVKMRNLKLLLVLYNVHTYIKMKMAP